ncbi:MAG: hypothetical protein Q4D59_10935 [Erysipelotrichaceae bacterium]|nr:hypothetical protein [Erysipelotrichaceae bacterium]
MVRWFRLFGNQYAGFWALGLLLFAVQEIPYLLMPFIHLKTNPIMNMTETSPVLDVCEKILGSLCIVLMMFVIHRDAVFFSIAEGREKLFFTLAALILLANFAGWALYFTGRQSLFVMMAFIVAMPPLYYMAIGLWRQNTPLVITGAVFLAVHFLHVLGNLR